MPNSEHDLNDLIIPSRKPGQSALTTRPDGSDVDRRSHSYSHGFVPRASTASVNPALPSLCTERFVGDLNPEAVIRERLDEPTGNPLRDRIGLWISSPVTQGAADAQRRRRDNSTDALPTRTSHSSPGSGDAASILQQRYMSAMQACKRLPVATYRALTAIYFSTVNRIVPLLDEHEFISAQTEGSSSVFLERAICLVAAKDRTAASHLRLIEHGEVMNTRQFCSELYNGLVAAIDAELEPNRLTRIRVLALMSLHCEGYEGAEAASLHLCQAIHQAQTVGLHLDRPDRKPADPLVQLFWCLWTLDKIHASIGGRPVLLADRDIGIEKPKGHAQNLPGAFGVWLAISDLLATVISFYRPSASNACGWEDGFPAFEDIVGGNAQGSLDFATLGLSLPPIWIRTRLTISTCRVLGAILSLRCHPVLSTESDREPQWHRSLISSTRSRGCANSLDREFGMRRQPPATPYCTLCDFTIHGRVIPPAPLQQADHPL